LRRFSSASNARKSTADSIRKFARFGQITTPREGDQSRLASPDCGDSSLPKTPDFVYRELGQLYTLHGGTPVVLITQFDDAESLASYVRCIVGSPQDMIADAVDA
jgi:hypothetical protein